MPSVQGAGSRGDCGGGCDCGRTTGSGWLARQLFRTPHADGSRSPNPRQWPLSRLPILTNSQHLGDYTQPARRAVHKPPIYTDADNLSASKAMVHFSGRKRRCAGKAALPAYSIGGTRLGVFVCPHSLAILPQFLADETESYRICFTVGCRANGSLWPVDPNLIQALFRLHSTLFRT